MSYSTTISTTDTVTDPRPPLKATPIKSTPVKATPPRHTPIKPARG